MSSLGRRWPADRQTVERWPTAVMAQQRSEQLRALGYRTYTQMLTNGTLLHIHECTLGHPKLGVRVYLESLPPPSKELAQWRGRTYKQWVAAWWRASRPRKTTT